MLAVALTCAVALTAPASAAQLPDERAYELVSPPQKNGVEVIQQTGKTHVAADGDGVTFSALGGFGTLQGTSFDAEYLSRRTALPGTNGWTTRGINPVGGSDTFPATLLGNTPTYVNAFTPDLSAAIYRSWRPLTDAPNVADVSNLYRIDGLGADAGTVHLLSDSVNALPTGWPATLKLLIQPALAGASTDLAHVVFESKLNLTVDAPPQGLFCLFLGFGCPTALFENVDGSVRLVGRIPDGADTECDDVDGPACTTAPTSQAGISASARLYSQRMVSDDGRRILFQVPAGADSGAIYLREDGVRTLQIAPDGQLWDASSDGARAFFITGESLLPQDTDSSPDLYMYDRSAPAGDRLTLVSASSVADGFVETVVGASDDGRYVYFVCAGQLLSGEPPADTTGLYAWHDGQLAFIGSLQGLGEAQLDGPRTDFTFPSTISTARVAPDGRHLLFMTQSDAGFSGRGGFEGYDHAGHRELYLYDADTGRLACASCNPTGRAATADALTDVRDGAANSGRTSKLSHALSDDGRFVFFTTGEALVPDDTNGRLDAYEYDAEGGKPHLLSSGTDASPSYFIDAGDDGRNAFFATRQRLVGWDVDGSYDLYDARVGGGFPEPARPVPPCSGEACRGQAAQGPAAAALGSVVVRGAGNARAQLRRHRRCGRRARLRKVGGRARCVRRRPHRRGTRASVRDERSGR